MAARLNPGCPKCGSYVTHRYGWLLSRIYRQVIGKPTKWACSECHTHFRGRRERQALYAIFICVAIFFTILFFDFLHAMMSVSPKVWAKRKVVVVYRWVYGPTHKQKLHEHLGFMYGDVGEQIDDYAGHDY